MRVMLADNLSDRAQFLRGGVVGADSPCDRAVSRNDSDEARLAATDDDVIRCESLIAFVELVVRPDIGCGVDVQPVKTAARQVDA